MSKISLLNDTCTVLRLNLEPIGSDHWMRPGEEFTVVCEDEKDEHFGQVVAEDSGRAHAHLDGPVTGDVFEVYPEDDTLFWVVTVAVVGPCPNGAVYDQDGNRADCGHQRPIEMRRAESGSTDVIGAGSGDG